MPLIPETCPVHPIPKVTEKLTTGESCSDTWLIQHRCGMKACTQGLGWSASTPKNGIEHGTGECTDRRVLSTVARATYDHTTIGVVFIGIWVTMILFVTGLVASYNRTIELWPTANSVWVPICLAAITAAAAIYIKARLRARPPLES